MITSVPTGKVESDRVATPLPFTGRLPNVVVPVENVTAPVGVPVVCEITVAVRIINWLSEEGLGEEVSATVGVCPATTWDSTGDVLALSIAAPL